MESIEGFNFGFGEKWEFLIGENELRHGFRLVVFVDGAIGINGAIVEVVMKNLNGVGGIITEFIGVSFGEIGWKRIGG